MNAALIDRLRAEDPQRLAMALLAPGVARPRLLSLYALNAELARTALSAREPLIAEMRVRWWADRLAAMSDGPPPPHELLTALWDAWGTETASLAPLAEARMHDAAREPFDSTAEVRAYAAATGGRLMSVAAGVLGARGDAVEAQGLGTALTAWLAALPALQPLGLGSADSSPEAIRELAGQANESFDLARAARRSVPRAAAPALFAGAGVRRMLDAIAAGENPALPSDFARRGALARLALTGRWWV